MITIWQKERISSKKFLLKMIQFIDEIIVENPPCFSCRLERSREFEDINEPSRLAGTIGPPTFFSLADSFYFSSLSFPFFSFPPTDWWQIRENRETLYCAGNKYNQPLVTRANVKR